MRFFVPLSLVLIAISCAGTTGSSDAGSPLPDAGPEGSFCTIDEECGGGYRCRGGVCITQECMSRDDCQAGRVCSEGECILPTSGAACTNSDECPSPYLCDGFARRCWDPMTGEYLGGNPASSSSSSSSGNPSSGTTSGGGSSSSSSTGGAMVDVGGLQISNTEHSGEGLIPMGTRVPQGGILIIARNATKAEFQQKWGVTLGANVVYLNSNNDTSGPPVINGGEKYTLKSHQNQTLDGATIVGTGGKSIRRIHAGSAGSMSNWTIDDDTSATPGTTELGPNDHGIFISEWSDASGGGQYIFEFIELYVNP